MLGLYVFKGEAGGRLGYVPETAYSLELQTVRRHLPGVGLVSVLEVVPVFEAGPNGRMTCVYQSMKSFLNNWRVL